MFFVLDVVWACILKHLCAQACSRYCGDSQSVVNVTSLCGGAYNNFTLANRASTYNAGDGDFRICDWPGRGFVTSTDQSENDWHGPGW